MKHILALARRSLIISLTWCITLVSAFDIISSLSIGTVLRAQKKLYFIHTSNSINDGRLSESDAFHGAGPIPTHDQAQDPESIDLITSLHLSSRTGSILSEDLIEEQLSRYALDEVWSEDFMDGIAVSSTSGSGKFQIDLSAVRWMKAKGIKTLYHFAGSLIDDNNGKFFTDKDVDLQGIALVQLSPVITIPPGPFAITVKNTDAPRTIHDVYLLVPDVYEAFVFGVIPNGPGDSWIQTNFTFPNANDLALTVNRDLHTPAQYIPILSRLRSQLEDPDDTTTTMRTLLPLTGKRFVVKDIFDMRGVTTTAGSSAYAKVHPIAKETAPSIQALIDLGAIPVGKTRTSQFAHGANSWEFVDFSYSWNPRGDGYLTAMSSSSGSACAIAGYGWIDFAIGSDTRGSVRRPASVVGAYGIRPSFGSMDRQGVVPLAEELDTIGFFARDPGLFHEVATLWQVVPRYAESPVKDRSVFSGFPSLLYYPYDHFPVKNPMAQAIYDDFIDALCQQLGITKIPFNVTEKLSTYFPASGFSQFKRLSDILAEYHSWNVVGRPLSELHLDIFGKEANFDPVPQSVFSRARGPSLTFEDYQAAVSLKNAFTESISTDLFRHDHESCSDSILVYDTGMGGAPSYRVKSYNSYPGASDTQTVLKPWKPAILTENLQYVASMGGLVEITVPLGQVEYYSYVSGEWEALPVSVQLVTRRGCDEMLLAMVKELANRGIVKEVMVGKASFSQFVW
ncbi:amidase signature enzyme [Dendrothele bispora CBS 962.96]|uniref:Amidase signature enzyme n=1 Tax=Dendrothele bispora (strain CBS 962.96) TaxID=1314807 RepID=A0A4S8MKN7_DENBC|nr:amidase signature enzyme [Dendrothele bispora CBS 962.96]